MQYVANAVFLLTVHSQYLETTGQTLNCTTGAVDLQEIFYFTKLQVDYILGSNPMGLSYLVGFGPKYPENVHHRGASMPSYLKERGFIGCTQGYDYFYGRLLPNHNVLTGALVGGPDDQDEYKDKRSNFAQTEACTYNTAPLVGIFAKLGSLGHNSSHFLSIASM